MYNAYVTRIKNVRKHSNADRLNVGECFGNQVIVSLQTEEGTLGVYFPTDGQLSEEYCEVNNLVIKKDENGVNVGGYLDPNKRNIRTMKLRSEISDGLFMPITSLEKFTDVTKLKEGDIVNVLNGVEICKKYIPIHNGRPVREKGSQVNNKKKENKESFPIFHEHIDTSQLAYNLGYFKEGMVCYKTLKIHGTSAHTMNTLVLARKTLKGAKLLFARLFRKKTYEFVKEWKTVTGTRRTILDNFSGGYYGDNAFRKKYHDFFDGKLHKGEQIFYEIVGYLPSGKPIISECANNKVQDKEFSKKYGDKTVFSYGCEVGENDIYVYRMTITNEDGLEVDYPWDLVKLRCEQIGVKHVPELERFIYTSQEDLLERMNKDLEEADPIGKTHVREGYVIRVEGAEKFKAFKHKGYFFKCLEGIIKDSAQEPDMEEEQGE